MKLKPEDFDKIEDKQLANVLRKLQKEQTLTARDQAILERERAKVAGEVQTPGNAAPASGYAKTWDELATACSVDRRTLTNVRDREAKELKQREKEWQKADGRKEIAWWIRFLDEKGVRGRGVNNQNADVFDERALRLKREHFQLEKAIYELKTAKDETVPISHVETALGHMLAKFSQALNGLPGRIASGIDEADQAELLKLLTRAEKDKLTYKKLRSMIEKGHVRPFADIHARREFVTVEIDSVRRLLVKCEYLEADPAADEED